MRTLKIILASMSAIVLAASCTSGNYVSKAEYDELKSEYRAIRQNLDETQQKYIDQNAEMSRIVEQMASITGKTNSLRVNVENGSARVTQAEKIQNSIEDVKYKLVMLERATAKKDKEFREVVENLKKVINSQEAEIVSLKNTIAAKDARILEQKDTIKIQDDKIQQQFATIMKQQAELEKTVARQAELLFNAGVDLEELGDAAPEVSWKKNKEKMELMTLSIYKQALFYYEQAKAAGYNDKEDRLGGLQSKIAAIGK